MDQNEQSSGAPSLAEQVRRVRQYWWVVAAIVVLAVGGAVASTMRAPTTYTASSASIVSSNTSSPDQEAVLVLGYVDYFNGAPYQSRLAQELSAPKGVTFSATTAAASPIMIIEATSSSRPDEAQALARRAASIFRQNVNSDRSAAAVPLRTMQQYGGVSSSAPSLKKNVVFGTVGGLVIGVLLALLVGRLSPRVRSGDDLRYKAGLTPLIEISRQTARDLPQLRARVRQLANLVRSRLTKNGSVTVLQPRGGTAAGTVAWEMARQWAEQGHTTLLVRAEGCTDIPGLPSAQRLDASTELLAWRARPSTRSPLQLEDVAQPGPVPDMWWLTGVGVENLATLLERASSFAEFVVVEMPSIMDAADAPLGCAATDGTLLVVDAATARAADTIEAAAVVRTSGRMLGTVLLHQPKPRTESTERPRTLMTGAVEFERASVG